MRLHVVQDFGTVDPSSIGDAYRSKDLYASLRDLPFVGSPAVTDYRQGVDSTDGSADAVVVAVQWEVLLELPAVALAFVDPGKLGFVEESELGPTGTGTFRIIPDHYPKLLRGSGETAITQAGSNTLRTTSGTLKVDLGWKGKLFEGQVEQAIADGLAKALKAQVPQVLAFVDSAH